MATTYNIKQVNYYDTKNKTAVLETIVIDNEEYTIPYVTAFDNTEKPMIKMGYCCAEDGIGLPIFVTTTGKSAETEIRIGSTGMYEFQPETWNSEDEEDNVTSVKVTKVRVPQEIEYTLDYAIVAS